MHYVRTHKAFSHFTEVFSHFTEVFSLLIIMYLIVMGIGCTSQIDYQYILTDELIE